MSRKCSAPRKVAGMKFKACDDRYAVEVVARDSRDRYAGALTLSKEKRDGQQVLVVDQVEVVPEFRKKRLGTKMYEWAARIACRLAGRPLTSSTQRSEWSESFWQKQQRKGRAACASTGTWRDGGAGKYWLGPRADMASRLEPEAFDRLMEQLPKPARDPVYNEPYWPCERYVLTCPAPRSLAGLRRRRRSSRRRRR